MDVKDEDCPQDNALLRAEPIHTPPHECAYFRDAREAAEEIILYDAPLMSLSHIYFQEGYRRLGNFYYRPICPACSDCVPLRIDVPTFQPSRSQRRTLKRNADVTVSLLIPFITDEKIDLYMRYQSFKHDEDPTEHDPEHSLSMLHYGYDRIIEMNYHVGGRLIGVGIVDEAQNALSSVYFYYDPEELYRRPGIFSMLREIELCALLGKRYHYLGYYVRNHPKMHYKTEFQPHEILVRGQWQRPPAERNEL